MPWLARFWLGGRPGGFAACSVDAEARGIERNLLDRARDYAKGDTEHTSAADR